MKKSGILLAGLVAVLAACAPETESAEPQGSAESDPHAGHDMSKMPLSDKAIKDKKEAAALLVERFDAASCSEADLIGSLRRTSPEEGETIMRGFKVPESCAEEALAAVKQLGFEESAPDTFSGTSANGEPEEVKIVELADGSATVEWESSQK